MLLRIAVTITKPTLKAPEDMNLAIAEDWLLRTELLGIFVEKLTASVGATIFRRLL